jgi:phospholipase/lecithinase/hemolysin
VATLSNQRSLYMIWIGLNPILDLWTTAVGGGLTANGRTTAQTTLAAVLASLSAQLSLLVAAKPAGRLVILTIPGLQLLPTIINRYPSADALAFARQLTTTYNEGIYALSTSLGANATVYNASALWTNYTTTPKGFGLTNLKQAYLQAGGGGNAANFLFYDSVHPTTTIHQDLARRLAGYLNGTLPAT